MIKKILLLGSCLLAGCAFSVYDSKVNYQYDKPVDINLAQGAKEKIKIDTFTDGRSVENPRLIMNQQNLNGQTTSGGWQAEKPISDIVQDAVTQGLTRANIPLVESGASATLEGQLVGFDVNVIMGMWQGTANGKLTVKMKLKKAGKVIWSDTLTGSSSIKSAMPAPADVLRGALDDLVTRLLSDETFIQSLK